jgi:hypothetical protein
VSSVLSVVKRRGQNPDKRRTEPGQTPDTVRPATGQIAASNVGQRVGGQSEYVVPPLGGPGFFVSFAPFCSVQFRVFGASSLSVRKSALCTHRNLRPFQQFSVEKPKPSAISMISIRPLKTPRHFNFSTLNFYSVVERGSTINEVGRHRQC